MRYIDSTSNTEQISHIHPFPSSPFPGPQSRAVVLALTWGHVPTCDPWAMSTNNVSLSGRGIRE